MEKGKKAEYFFGSKQVLERAADEDEFEGSLTTSTELTNLTLINELPSAFWRSIWLDFANQGTIQISDPNIETGYIGLLAKPDYQRTDLNAWGTPIWRMSGELAGFKNPAWPGWQDVEFFNVFQVIGFEDLKAVVKYFIAAHAYANDLFYSFKLSEMQYDPADLVNIRSWRDFWTISTQNRQQDIGTVAPNSDGPDQVFCFTLNYNRKLWIAKKERIFYVIWTGNY